mmetsp:Transcript_3557/g.9612  ORF Transcript_3557/g.9612 Transcript_3557/m.9612 type:complete len:330 (-) Transcript_3557:523-1512(-)
MLRRPICATKCCASLSSLPTDSCGLMEGRGEGPCWDDCGEFGCCCCCCCSGAGGCDCPVSSAKCTLARVAASKGTRPAAPGALGPRAREPVTPKICLRSVLAAMASPASASHTCCCCCSATWCWRWRCCCCCCCSCKCCGRDQEAAAAVDDTWITAAAASATAAADKMQDDAAAAAAAAQSGAQMHAQLPPPPPRMSTQRWPRAAHEQPPPPNPCRKQTAARGVRCVQPWHAVLYCRGGTGMPSRVQKHLRAAAPAPGRPTQHRHPPSAAHARVQGGMLQGQTMRPSASGDADDDAGVCCWSCSCCCADGAGAQAHAPSCAPRLQGLGH